MKKYISLFGALALIAASCSVDENKMARPGTEDGSRIVLSGTSTMNTKVSIGEKDGEVYPLLRLLLRKIILPLPVLSPMRMQNFSPSQPDGYQVYSRLQMLWSRIQI